MKTNGSFRLCVAVPLLLIVSGGTTSGDDPMEASILAKADRPWFAQFMVGEPIVAGFPGESEADRVQRVKPWRDAKFGLFLHWGPQRAGGEYVIPKKTLDQFNPVLFDADQWVRTAKDLGFRYIVITAKHHAGFCLFDSAFTDHDIIDATPFGRNPIKELADACAEHGMLLGFYYSVWDLHHPGYSKDPGNANYAAYHQYMLDQSEELLTKYGPVVTMWLDGEWVNSWTVERATQYRDHLRRLQPNLVMVDRIGQRRLGDGDYGSCENFTPYVGDNMNRPWESCQRFDGRWFYSGKEESQTVEWALHNLVDTASRGGNLLLNMGPTPEGLLPPWSVEKLKPLGEWLRRHGECIYASEKGPHFLLEWGTCTRRGNTLYYHIYDWPDDSRLVIPGLNEDKENAGIEAISLHGRPNGPAITFEMSGNDVVVHLPRKQFDPLVDVLQVEFAGTPSVNNTVRPLTRRLRPQTGNADVDTGDYYLPAAFAKIHGEKLYFSLGTGAGAQRENLKGWTEMEDYPEWSLQLERPGDYELQVTYSSWMESGRFAVEIAGQTLEHTVTVSKLRGKQSPLAAGFHTETLGRVHISEPGDFRLTVKPIEIDAKAIQYDQGLMMLREVVLRPIDGP